jgi:tetratricopeptide (TPR) repeat protein
MTVRLAALISLLLAAPVLACLWDSDTLAREARGLPGMAEILTGRFERPVPLYYQMRLERVAKDLAADPTKLAAYDDAAVACDRLGKHDEGIEWLRKKREWVGKAAGSPDARDHLYRYHANLGTLLAHKWFKAGADREAMQDLKDGRDHIAAAIEINPDAHFGREKYQLLAMNWIIKGSSGHRYSIPTLLEELPSEPPGPIPDDAAKGLAGLIVLGNAWESLDITYALGLALDARRDASLAYLAGLRCEELFAAGKRSFHPDLDSVLDESRVLETVRAIGHPAPDLDDLKTYFTKARAAAEDWAKAREDFMLTKLNAGKHPDTDADFWTGYTETPPPALPNGILGFSSYERGHIQLGSVGLAVAIGLCGVAVVLVIGARRLIRRRKASAA